MAAQLASVANEAERRVGVWSQRPRARVDAATIRSAKRLIDETLSDLQRLSERDDPPNPESPQN